MDKQEMRSIAEQVFSEKLSQGQFSAFKIPNHVHNGIDSPRINQSNIQPNSKTSGNIDFLQNATYKIPVASNPTSVWFYGNAIQRNYVFVATLPLNYVFTVTAANATAGATYTNSGQTFTVVTTIVGGTTLTTTGTGNPAASGTLTKASGTGDATITYSSFTAPANATIGATYTNNGQTFTVVSTTTGGTTLITAGTGSPSASGTLTKASGSGDATIIFTWDPGPSGNGTTASHPIAIRSQVIGSAQIGPTFYYQPSTSTSVTLIGSPIQNVIQSNSYFLIDSGTSPVTVRTASGEGHLISVAYPTTSDIVARMTLLLSNGTMTPIVTQGNDTLMISVVLATGWELHGNIVIT